MDPAAVELFKQNVHKLQIGDTVEHVSTTLGPPDADVTVNKDEKVQIFTYYVTRQKPDIPLESDQKVLIGIDRHNKVKAIYSNVNGIESKNSP